MARLIEGPTNWKSSDMKDEASWCIRLSKDQIATVANALRTARSSGATLDTLTKENFPLSGFDDLIADVRSRLEKGRGLAVVRGFPALDYNKDDLRMIYWGLGLYMGKAVSQSSKGDLLGDVKDFGQSPHSSKGRGYMSREQLGFHADTSDVVCLMVLRAAKKGGLSMICSSVAIRNEIAKTRPDLLEVLYQLFYWSWKGQQKPGEKPYYTTPIYSEQDGCFASRYIKTHILSAVADFPGEVPALTELQLEAMAMIDKLANNPEFHFGMMFEPGDMQFLNNHVTMHARTEFEDYEEPDRKRHLLRMWLSMPNTRPLNKALSAIFENPAPGAVRGGFPSRTGTHSFETVPAQD